MTEHDGHGDEKFMGLARWELTLISLELWAFAAGSWLGVSVLLSRVANVPQNVASGIGFVVGALLAYPAARVWYRRKGATVSFARYAIVWIIVSVAVVSVREALRQ